MSKNRMQRTAFFALGALALVLLTVGFVWYRMETPKRQDAVKMKNLFAQPQWNAINFKEGLTDTSMRPLLDDSQQQLERARRASSQAGVKNPILPYFDSAPNNSNAHYYYARYFFKLTDTQGYELRFIAFADSNTLATYSIWVSAIPQTIDSNNNFINTPEQKEFIYSVEATPEKIEKDVTEYLASKGYGSTSS